ncbi:hypothetical protein [Micromonospora sp. WMMD812]|uniref:hypothetical protein n=1 Tax=Micromonospora sp. WMMD812 TaxID=3015152 RepID=UPI00248AE7C8|nr:hypothetical protein [Micromonospora sp. WMMD812]WBB69352.1 hypothetical protein O7603_08380 [Micromonospora sp. WMMD812]
MAVSFRAAGLGAALLVVLAVGGCDSGGGDPVVAPTGAVETSAGVPATTAPAAGPAYTAAGLDLCARTDLKPIVELAPTVTRTDPKPPPGRPGAACLFELRTPSGHPANLRVEVSTPATADEARLLYRGTQQATGMTPAGAVTGVGEEAEAFTKRSDPGYKYAEYMVHSRAGNLVVKVWLAVGGDTYAPTSTLAEESLAILKATRAAVPTA